MGVLGALLWAQHHNNRVAPELKQGALTCSKCPLHFSSLCSCPVPGQIPQASRKCNLTRVLRERNVRTRESPRLKCVALGFAAMARDNRVGDRGVTRGPYPHLVITAAGSHTVLDIGHEGVNEP